MALSIEDFRKALFYYIEHKDEILKVAQTKRGKDCIPIIEQLRDKFPSIQSEDVYLIVECAR